MAAGADECGTHEPLFEHSTRLIEAPRRRVRPFAEDRRELRVLVAATVEAANQWFSQLRDQLYERLETVIDVTAQSSASAAAAVKALRKDIKAVEADPRLLDALAQLSDEIERLERRIPARVALRLPDSQLNAIVDAVRAPAGRSASFRRAQSRLGCGASGSRSARRACRVCRLRPRSGRPRCSVPGRTYSSRTGSRSRRFSSRAQRSVSAGRT